MITSFAGSTHEKVSAGALDAEYIPYLIWKANVKIKAFKYEL